MFLTLLAYLLIILLAPTIAGILVYLPMTFAGVKLTELSGEAHSSMVLVSALQAILGGIICSIFAWIIFKLFSLTFSATPLIALCVSALLNDIRRLLRAIGKPNTLLEIVHLIGFPCGALSFGVLLNR